MLWLHDKCENGDGRPVKFSGFGHHFCWECYYNWARSQVAGKPEQMSLEPKWTQKKGE